MTPNAIPIEYRDQWEEFDVAPYVGWQPALDWVRAEYGIDPNDVPTDSTIRLDYAHRTVTYDRIFRDDSGQLVFNGRRVRVERVEVQMESSPKPWPFDWLDPLRGRRQDV